VSGKKKGLRNVTAAAVSVGLLVPAAVFGGAGLAKSSSAAQYQYGKTTICHRTHSKKKPYVKITVSNAALKAHAKHGDVIPAPAAGCSTTAIAKAKKAKKAKTHGKPASAGTHPGKGKGKGSGK
jgi:hypothetical protein